MTTHTFFPTLIHAAPLGVKDARRFNDKLLRECLHLEQDDGAGRKWSARNYPGGYTSYNSANRMQQLSPTFAQLERALNRHVRRFAQQLEYDLAGRELAMTDCWVNIMPPGVVHSLHLHPLSTLSGTYYVSTPRGSPGLKFEDPRLDRFMAAPPRKADSSTANKHWIVMPATAGRLLLFESWLRHEVTPNVSSTPRISVSFNYNWF